MGGLGTRRREGGGGLVRIVSAQMIEGIYNVPRLISSDCKVEPHPIKFKR